MEDLSEEAYRRSMYEVSRDIRKRTEAVSRLLFIGEIRYEGSQPAIDIGEETSKWFRDRNSTATGLIIITKKFFQHIVEDSSESLFELLYWIRELVNRDNPPLLKVSVISFTEENPSRIFTYWNYITQSAKDTGEDKTLSIEPEEMQWQLYNNICQVGIRLSKLFVGEPQPTRVGLGAAMKSTSKELKPSQETLEVMLGEGFSTIDDFISIYVAPINVVSDSELVWPPPPELSFK